jgi:uncharacterized protein
LHRAAFNGHLETVKALLAAGADVNKPDLHGWSPLHFAALKGHDAVVQALVDYNAEVDNHDFHGWTPLRLAAFKGHDAVVQILIAADADVNKPDSDGYTPLHIATAFNGNLEVVKALITAGAHANKHDSNGYIPLNWAAINGYRTIADFLTQFKQRAPELSKTVAQALHPRLGAQSPMSLLPQDLMRHIAILSAAALSFDSHRGKDTTV